MTRLFRRPALSFVSFIRFHCSLSPSTQSRDHISWLAVRESFHWLRSMVLVLIHLLWTDLLWVRTKVAIFRRTEFWRTFARLPFDDGRDWMLYLFCDYTSGKSLSVETGDLTLERVWLSDFFPSTQHLQLQIWPQKYVSTRLSRRAIHVWQLQL